MLTIRFHTMLSTGLFCLWRKQINLSGPWFLGKNLEYRRKFLSLNRPEYSKKGKNNQDLTIIELLYAICHMNKPSIKYIPFNKEEQNWRFCWPTSQLIMMLVILIGGRFCAFTCPTWNFLIWNQQNLHIKENDQHPAQLLPNKLVNLFITVLLVSIRRSLCSIVEVQLRQMV